MMSMRGRRVARPWCLRQPAGNRRSTLIAMVLMALLLVGAACPGDGVAQVATEAHAPETSTATAGMSDRLPTSVPDAGRGDAVPASSAAEMPAAGNLMGHARELSPMGMFLAADIVVKVVMVGLAAASFLIWTIWVAKWIQLWASRRRITRDLKAIAAMPGVDAAFAAVRHQRSPARAMLDVVSLEKRGSGGYLKPASVERIHSRLGEIEARITRDIRGGMSFLATVGATGPFVGLFGTVWGIMNSFIGISKAQTTSLAVVAPGIAEALLATAVGLIAAIPAVILYNNLGKGIGTFRRLVRETRGEVERIASREMEGQSAQRYPNLAFAAE